MALKASALKSNEAQKKAISREVSLILARLDDELKVAHEQGKSKASVSIPITFAIPYMSNKDAQRIVYYRVLTSLIDREFNVKISLEEDASIFLVSWLTDEEQEDVNIQHALLAKHTLNRKHKDLT
jgi:hypothetical protein